MKPSLPTTTTDDSAVFLRFDLIGLEVDLIERLRGLSPENRDIVFARVTCYHDRAARMGRKHPMRFDGNFAIDLSGAELLFLGCLRRIGDTYVYSNIQRVIGVLAAGGEYTWCDEENLGRDPVQ